MATRRFESQFTRTHRTQQNSYTHSYSSLQQKEAADSDPERCRVNVRRIPGASFQVSPPTE